MDPTRTVGDTEWTRDAGWRDRQTDGRTDGVKPIYPPNNFIVRGGIKSCAWYLDVPYVPSCPFQGWPVPRKKTEPEIGFPQKGILLWPIILEPGCWLSATETGHHITVLVQDCSNSSALALELLQSCTKTSIYGSRHKGAAVLLPGFAIKW